MKRYRQILVLALWQAACWPALLLGQEVDETARQRLEQWEKAALNREWAAVTRQDEASELRKHADSLLRKEYIYDTERMSNCNQAGDALKRSADLEAASSVNYERASSNWEKVAAGWSGLGQLEKQRRIEERGVQATEQGWAACERAADAYEMAAAAYGRDNADQPEKAAAASEKAAVWREKLAQRT